MGNASDRSRVAFSPVSVPATICSKMALRIDCSVPVMSRKASSMESCSTTGAYLCRISMKAAEYAR